MALSSGQAVPRQQHKANEAIRVTMKFTNWPPFCRFGWWDSKSWWFQFIIYTDRKPKINIMSFLVSLVPQDDIKPKRPDDRWHGFGSFCHWGANSKLQPDKIYPEAWKCSLKGEQHKVLAQPKGEINEKQPDGNSLLACLFPLLLEINPGHSAKMWVRLQKSLTHMTSMEMCMVKWALTTQ